MGILTVYLDRAENLANTDWGTGSDPYVKLEVEQDNWTRDVDYGMQKSSTKPECLSPVWGETFQFTLPTLDNMVLTCKVKDKDLLKDDKLGSCKFKLEDMGLNATPKAVDKVIDRNLLRKDGRLFLKLSWEA